MPPGPEAWHEAGHALVAHLFGGRVREVTLESEEDEHEGHVAVVWPRPTIGAPARRLAAVALAGPVAELVFLGDDAALDPAVLSAWRGDWAEAQARLAELHGAPDEREATLRAILRELRALFEDPHHYARLARLADALDAHATLDRQLFLEAVS